MRLRGAFPLLLALLMIPGPALCLQTQSTGGVWVDVPFVAQQGEGCGAAVISMVMQYWDQQLGRPPSPNAAYAHIEQMLYSREGHGVYASAMEGYFRENGYQTFAFIGEQGDLATHLRKGRPLIAALEPGEGQPLHYVVVAGVDLVKHTVLLNDPAQRKLLQEDGERFEQEWQAAGHWTLLAVPETTAR